MPGKAYTMREMKQIVEYLAERKLYGEVRGRRMWIDMANACKLDRTWQSLKETFLKRILPDIHNPYYKLTVEQICSFKQGYDVGEKNKLEFRSTSTDSRGNGDNAKDDERPGPSKNVEDNTTSGNLNRKRNLSLRDRSSRLHCQRRRTNSHYSNNANDSGSSDYTTMSDSDMSPPRTSRSRHERKYSYVKPESYNILKLEDGLLFVTDGKKIYPLVKDGKNVKNYLTFNDDSDQEESDSYWKSKYLEEKIKCAEEKIRADELARLWQHAQEQQTKLQLSPVLQTKTLQSNPEAHNHIQHKENANKAEIDNKSETNDEKPVKIKLTKNNEIELECQWPHVQPVLEKMAQMFRKPSVAEDKVNEISLKRRLSVTELSSGKTTPITAEVKEKVNKIESEIFKEIEEIDKSHKTETTVQGPTAQESNAQEPNITTRRRGRPRKVQASPSPASVTSVETPKKKAKISNEERKEEVNKPVEVRKKSRVTEVQSDADSVSIGTRRTRTPGKFTENVITKNKSPINSSSPTRSASNSKLEVEIPDDSQVRYMFPKSSKRVNSRNRSKAKNDPQKTNSRYPPKNPRIYSSPDNTNSIESSYGYQDSDVSLEHIVVLKRKKKVSQSCGNRNQNGNKIRRKSCPYEADDDTFEANPSITRQSNVQNSSLNTEIYRSESYQLLMLKTNSFRPLNKIDENDPTSETTPSINSGSNVTMCPLKNIVDDNVTITKINKNNSPKTEGNSSSVSLPMSPELSVVENISIRKETVTNIENYPTINETQCNDVARDGESDKYFISEVDVSVPLMEQDCELRQNKSKKIRESQDSRVGTVSNKMNSVTVEEQSSSDSLDIKLKNLLLESAKKMARHVQKTDLPNKASIMEVDTVPAKENNKSKAKKRCSTPRKKKNPKKCITAAEPVIDEHMESCSRGSRKSCPPTLNIIDCEYNVAMNKNLDNVITDTNISDSHIRSRKKKDVIKVKILRPKNNDLALEIESKKRKISVCTDSGINDTESGVFLQGCDDSIELIHNHSDTCLRANECIGESVEFIEKSKSVILLDSNSARFDDLSSCHDSNKDGDLPELFCNNAQDATSVKGIPFSDVDSTSNGTVYHSPVSNNSLNSLITEDLSDDMPVQHQRRTSKWYLLSEEETNNTNLDAWSRESNAGSFGANLMQIFPITCAVPNLSTITETSKDGDGRKPNLDGDNCLGDAENEILTNCQNVI